MASIYSTEIKELGAEVPEFFETGLLPGEIYLEETGGLEDLVQPGTKLKIKEGLS